MASFNLINGIMKILCFLCVVIMFSDNVNGKAAQSYPGYCKKANTRYTIPERCDTYVECIDSKPTRKICRPGLYFYSLTDVKDTTYPCEELNAKLCGSREHRKEYVYNDELCDQQQFSQPKALAGDLTSCNEYVECANGQKFDKQCPAQLAWDPVGYKCDDAGVSPHCNAPLFCKKFGMSYNSETKQCN